MHARTRIALVGLALLSSLACRPTPSAEIELPSERASEAESEPARLGDQPTDTISVPVGPQLDWRAVDDRLAPVIAETGHERVRVDYDAEHPWFGSSAPLVTIVLFVDYQCPYSKRLAEALDQLLQSEGDTIRVVWRQLPLPSHAQAKLAAHAALAAHAQGAFASMHAWLFANQRTLSREAIEGEAALLGLDLGRFRADLDNDWIVGRVEADLAAAAHVHVNSTPSYFINGRSLRGARTIEQLRPILDEELALAQRLIDAGSGRLDVWARLLAAGNPDPAAPAPTPRPTPKTKKDRYVVDTKGLTRRGSKSAKVELLMCADFDCPYCARSVATLAALEQKYGKKLALFFRHNPLPMHVNAEPAHRAAVAAEAQGELWAMWELLFANQKARSQAELEGFATQLQLDLDQFRKDMADAATGQKISDDTTACSALDVTGTPTFFVNGRPIQGAQQVTEFERVIDEELAGKGPPPAKP